MEADIYLYKYKKLRYNLFKRKHELNVLYKLILTFCFACLTGVLAQARFYLPFTPVPVTGQVFAVLFAGVILGKYYGGISQLMYLSIGIIGVPWFQGMNSGLSYMMGPTGGYLIGFVLASFFIGYIVDKYVRARSFTGIFGLLFFSTFVLIYLPGLIWFYVWTGFSIGFIELIIMCVLPFITADILKTLITVGIAGAITPKTSYGTEVDT